LEEEIAMSNCGTLIAIRIEDREHAAVDVQRVLTKNGCDICVRLGLHDRGDGNVCSPGGTMILQMSCPPEDGKKVVRELQDIKGVKAQFIDLD
jgi:hypothetical protein